MVLKYSPLTNFAKYTFVLACFIIDICHKFNSERGKEQREKEVKDMFCNLSTISFYVLSYPKRKKKLFECLYFLLVIYKSLI